MPTLPVWARLPEEANAAGRLAVSSDDHYSKDRIERRGRQYHGRKHRISLLPKHYAIFWAQASVI